MARYEAPHVLAFTTYYDFESTASHIERAHHPVHIPWRMIERGDIHQTCRTLVVSLLECLMLSIVSIRTLYGFSAYEEMLLEHIFVKNHSQLNVEQNFLWI